MNCSRCGSDIRPGLDVCLRCGTTVTNSQSANNESSKPSSSNGSPDSGSNSSQPAGASSNAHTTPRVSSPSATQGQNTNTSNKSAPIILGAIALFAIFLIWNAANQSNKDTSSRSASTAQTSEQSRSQQSSNALGVRLVESKPPVGTNHVLTHDQIRYCHLEDIRLEAMRAEINQYSEEENSKFNSFIDDYNSRCTSYRYRTDSVSAVQKSIQGKEVVYRQEGIARVQSWRDVSLVNAQSPGSSNSTKPKPKPDPLVKYSQQILASLGYDAGPIDGLRGNKTTRAVMQFQQDYEFEVDGVIDKDFYSKLYELRPRDSSSQKKTRPTTSNNAKPAVNSKERACSHFKENDPSNFQLCLQGKLLNQPKTAKTSSSTSQSQRGTDNYYSIGSHKDDVLRLQGTPNSIDRYPSLSHEVWNYGYNEGSIEISTRTNRVQEFSNKGGLKIRIQPGPNTTSAEYYSIGSHKDDVLRLQGTPNSID
ncbi:peptidoglycan-binding protein, partial [Pseudomonadota bacterium]